MVTLLIRCRVSDYDAWLAKWRAGLQEHYDKGEVRSFQLWRGAEDPNLVVVTEVFESREVAEALVRDPATRERMASDGVELATIVSDLVDEVDSGER